MVVVGAGVAGTSAALTASQAGARVVLVDGGTGASTLSTGAIDAVPWQTGATSPVSTIVRSMLETLGAYLLPDAGARVATTAGVVRPARGHDAAILDVAPFAGGRVGVVSCD